MPTKKCKFCQTDIPIKAKVCPNCKKKQKKPIGCLIVIIAVIAIGAAGVSAGGGKDDSSSDIKISKGSASSQSSNDSSTENENSNNVVELNDTFETKGLKVSFTDLNLDYSVKDDKYDLYKPADGKKYIAVSFTFENTGDKEKYVSIYDFDCYADNTNCEQKYLPDDNDFINTNLSSGRNVSFTAYFEVPKDAKTIELEYEPDFLSDDKVIIKVL